MEDNRDTALVVKEYLEMNEITCDIAMTGKQALEKFSSQNFSILLTDILLPDHNGVEIARQCQEMKPDLNVIFLTGNKIGQKMPENSTLIEKPARPKKILEVINAIMTPLKGFS